MKSFGIGKKIWLGIGILVVGYSLTMFFVSVSGKQTENRLFTVSESWFPATKFCQTAVTSFNEQIKLYSDAVMLGDEEALQNANDRSQLTQQSLGDIAALSGISQVRKDEVINLQKSIGEFSAEAYPVYAKMAGIESEEESEEAASDDGDDDMAKIAVLAEKTETLKSQLSELNKNFTNNLKQELADISQATRHQRFLNFGIFLAVVVGALTLVSIIIRSITGPLNKTVGMLKDIAQGEGDLTSRLETKSRDEIGELALWFNTFVEKLQGIIKQISNNAESLTGSSTRLSGTASHMANDTEQMSQQSMTVSSNTDTMANQMSSMAESSNEMAANIRTVSAAVEEMTASISEIAKNAEQAASVANEASKIAQDSNQNISQLGDAADAIGKVIEVIQDIAEQTNLLALNATIEAARAGDAGKGFAVVAMEVKELANQTATATEDIAQRIRAIQNSTGSAVEGIGNITSVINKVNDVSRTIASAVEEQSITTKEIARNVSNTATASERVTNGVNESAAATQTIADTITHVKESAQHAADGASQTQTASQELSQMAEQLQGLVSQFKV